MITKILFVEINKLFGQWLFSILPADIPVMFSENIKSRPSKTIFLKSFDIFLPFDNNFLSKNAVPDYISHLILCCFK